MNQRVKDCNYCGKVVGANANREKEIMRGPSSEMRCVRQAFSSNEQYNVTSLTKRIVYKLCVLTHLTYGAETWGLTEHLERKRESAGTATERRITRVTL